MLEQEGENIGVYRKQIANIRDMEKLCRQILLNRIYPSSIYQLYESVSTICSISSKLDSGSPLFQYLCEENMEFEVEKYCVEFMDYLNSVLCIEKCKNIHSMSSADFEDNFIQTGYSRLLDSLMGEYDKKTRIFDEVKNQLNALIQKGSTDSDYIKINETDKSGKSLQITKTRGTRIKEIIEANYRF
jgi:DNA mismatch repair ATPase MutS